MNWRQRLAEFVDRRENVARQPHLVAAMRDALAYIDHLEAEIGHLRTDPCPCPARTLGGPITGRRIPADPSAWTNTVIPPVVQHDYTGDTTEEKPR